MTKIIYNIGHRLGVKGIGFENHQIVAHSGKGENDRFIIIPDSLTIF